MPRSTFTLPGLPEEKPSFARVLDSNLNKTRPYRACIFTSDRALVDCRFAIAVKKTIHSLSKILSRALSRSLKKRLVNRWKGERGRNLEKKVVRDQLNVTGVPNKLVAQYRDAATNYIMKNGPTMKQLEKYKKTWINLRNKSQR